MAAIKMKKITGAKALLLLAFILLLGSGCGGRMPVEVVELSQTIGKDMRALQVSYIALIKSHFKALRSQVDNFFKYRYIPEYTEDTIDALGLMDKARNLDADNAKDEVKKWGGLLVKLIDEKKKSLIAPIDKMEKELLLDVNESFAQLGLANNSITEYLKGVRKKQEVKDELLKTLKLDKLREKISLGLDTAAKLTSGSLQELAQQSGEN